VGLLRSKNKILVGKSERKRSHGRPKRRLKNTIKANLESDMRVWT
jgi:hypothetical protein